MTLLFKLLSIMNEDIKIVTHLYTFFRYLLKQIVVLTSWPQMRNRLLYPHLSLPLSLRAVVYYKLSRSLSLDQSRNGYAVMPMNLSSVSGLLNLTSGHRWTSSIGLSFAVSASLTLTASDFTFDGSIVPFPLVMSSIVKQNAKVHIAVHVVSMNNTTTL